MVLFTVVATCRRGALCASILRSRCGMSRRLLFLIAAPLIAQQVQDYQAALEQARRVNLEFAKRLPNFVADEHAIRYKSGPVKPPDWEVIDHIDSEISVKGKNGSSALEN
jgi:hypothetical protein